MAYKSLSRFIHTLESFDELIRVREFVSPFLEITEVVDRFSKNNGKAILFENTGTQFPVLINALGSEKRICLALGVETLDHINQRIQELFASVTTPRQNFFDKLKLIPSLREIASWMPETTKKRGKCQEIVMPVPDLTTLPVLTCWPSDGGPFITLPGVHTQDPETGIRNLGMYRMQVFGSDLTGMHWHLHKGSANHYEKYRKLRRRMPVTVTLGGDPVYIYAATAPLPENLDEYLLAGFLRRKKVELVKCLTNELKVPEDVDFVIEGYVDPEEELILEGPFGDHTGFYSLPDYFPRFHVTCITHRKEAVFPATIVGIPPQEDQWIGLATERIFLEPIRMTVAPEVQDMHMPAEGVFHNIVLVSIGNRYPAQAMKVMNALWGAGQMMFNKILVVFDQEVDLRNYMELLRQITATVDPAKDLHRFRGPVDILDHSSPEFASGSKMGVDATRKTNEFANGQANRYSGIFDKQTFQAKFPEITFVNDELLQQGISLVIAGIRKNVPHQIRTIAEEWIKTNQVQPVKFFLFVDHFLENQELSAIVWIAANHIDPIRDCFIVYGNELVNATLMIDATRKTLELDGFQRDWPNVIVMNDEIIRRIDQKWNELVTVPLIPSPSLRYKPLVFKEGPYA